MKATIRRCRSGVDPAALREGMARRLSRRNMIKLGGISVGALSLASILAACSGRLERRAAAPRRPGR